MFSSNNQEDVEIAVYNEYDDILNQLNMLKEVKIMKPIVKEIIGYTAVSLDEAKLLLQQKAEKVKYTLSSTDGVLGRGMYFSIGNVNYTKYFAKLNNQFVIQAKLNTNNCIDTLNGNSQLIISNVYNELVKKNKQITAENLYKETVKQYKKKVYSIRGISLCGRTLTDCNNQVILHELQTILMCVLDSTCIIDISALPNQK